MRVEPSGMGLVTYKKWTPEISLTASTIWETSQKTELVVMKQEVGFSQTSDLLTPCTWTSELEKCLWFLSHSAIGIAFEWTKTTLTWPTDFHEATAP